MHFSPLHRRLPGADYTFRCFGATQRKCAPSRTPVEVDVAEIPERVKTRGQLVEEAISAALDRDWKTALDLNQEIVSRFGVDEETHNRLGKLHTELGKMDEALSD
jgi:hypothetical protein